MPHDDKIAKIIKQIRGYGKKYLSDQPTSKYVEESLDGKVEGNAEYSAEMLSLANQLIESNKKELPLSAICNKLRNNEEFQQEYKRKREAKQDNKLDQAACANADASQFKKAAHSSNDKSKENLIDLRVKREKLR